jgi:thiol oxidase
VRAQRLVAFYPSLWPESEASAPDDLRQMLLCGTRSDQYVACKSSVPGARGFTCGLWLSLHAAANRLPDSPGSGTLLVNAMRAFNDHFFKCDECHEHLSKLLAAPPATQVSTRRDAVIWLWRLHNIVNARLMQEDAKSGRASSGPGVVKAVFPRTEVCPKCNGMKAEAAAAKAAARAKGGAQLASGSDAAEHQAWDLDVVYAHLLK